MNRRDFSRLLSLFAAGPALVHVAEGQAATPLSPTGPQSPAAHGPLAGLVSGVYAKAEAHPRPGATRISGRFVEGMLPGNIRLEAHFTHLTPGAPPEPIDHHKHSEMWLIHEGACTLMTNGVNRTVKAGEMGLCVAGDEHYISNASETEPASYFVVAVGPPE